MYNFIFTAATLAFPTLCLSLKLPTGKTQPSNIVEGAFLVQLSSSSALTGRDSQASQTTAHEIFHKRAETSNLNCKCHLPNPIEHSTPVIATFFQVVSKPGQALMLTMMSTRLRHTPLHKTCRILRPLHYGKRQLVRSHHPVPDCRY